ncbi:pantoate--beta-alanine ligase [Marinicrinis sediminis]|uniref:Pantothenate synthetase n=1 Tax=Marinicrinis sediminis TaxID=1652465 RepID=A0ABW5RCY7_9BACL
MNIIREVSAMRAWSRQKRAEGKTIGFVPTMGYLHEGHKSLLSASVQETDATVLSIFVNPLQFGPNEDLDRYPRDEERDVAIAKSAGAEVVFAPTVEEMYPNEMYTTVRVPALSAMLCGASRPGHFDGVATVVSKLFHIVQPHQAFFGLKDAQQAAIIEKMVQDLNMDVRIRTCPTVRESDGLAMSSRNKYLSVEERATAPELYRSLEQVREWVEQEEWPIGEILQKWRDRLQNMECAELDYAEILDYPSLQQPDLNLKMKKGQHRWIAACAVRFGQTRLIDNVLIGTHAKAETVRQTGGNAICI